MVNSTEEKISVVAVEDAKIKFAGVHKPKRTRTIQTIDTNTSRRPSVSAPKRPEKKIKNEKKNIDIVSKICKAQIKKKLNFRFLTRLNIYLLLKLALINLIPKLI